MQVSPTLQHNCAQYHCFSHIRIDRFHKLKIRGALNHTFSMPKCFIFKSIETTHLFLCYQSRTSTEIHLITTQMLSIQHPNRNSLMQGLETSICQYGDYLFVYCLDLVPCKTILPLPHVILMGASLADSSSSLSPPPLPSWQYC